MVVVVGLAVVYLSDAGVGVGIGARVGGGVGVCGRVAVGAVAVPVVVFGGDCVYNREKTAARCRLPCRTVVSIHKKIATITNRHQTQQRSRSGNNSAAKNRAKHVNKYG